MRKSLISSSLLAAALACSPLAFAATSAPAPATSTSTGTAPAGHHWHHHRMHHRMHRHGHGMYAFKELDLTTAQRSSIHQLMRQSFKQARSDMQTLRDKRMAFGKATPGTADYRNATNALAKAEADAAQTRVLQRADLNTKIYNLLTPAQRTKLADLRAQRHAKMEKWRATHKRHATQSGSATSSTK